MDLWAYILLILFALILVYVYVSGQRRIRFLERSAYYDQLTKIPTFDRFIIKAQQRLNQKSLDGYTLIYMDIEQFKFLNDTFGYEVGNRLLAAFSETFCSQMKPEEMLARVSGDMFVALTHPSVDMELIVRLDAFYFAYRLACQDILGGMRLNAVAGVYKITAEDDDIVKCIDRANTARKSIKGAYQSEITFYSEDMHRKMMQEKTIEDVMEQALVHGEFLLYLQPKYDMKTRLVAGAEALVRWRQADGTFVMPDAFIPLFEKNGFIIDLDFYIFEQVLKLQKKWLDEGRTVFPVAVNVSRIHVNEHSFFQRLDALLTQYGIRPELVELEITESLFLENEKLCIEFIRNLRERGFPLAMDDFGTGYSSLNLLREIAFDVLKIDKSFLSAADATRRDMVLISNIVHMAKELGMKVVAEGVEMEEQANFLEQIGCDLAQGYLFSRPVPVGDFEAVVFQAAKPDC